MRIENAATSYETFLKPNHWRKLRQKSGLDPKKTLLHSVNSLYYFHTHYPLSQETSLSQYAIMLLPCVRLRRTIPSPDIHPNLIILHRENSTALHTPRLRINGMLMWCMVALQLQLHLNHLTQVCALLENWEVWFQPDLLIANTSQGKQIVDCVNFDISVKIRTRSIISFLLNFYWISSFFWRLF